MSRADSPLSIIEQATRRLEELQRAGVSVPWAPAGFAEEPAAAAAAPVPVAASASAAARFARHAMAVDIDINRLAAAGFAVPGGPRGAAVDEFRVIKRPLLKNASLQGAAALRRGNIVVVTSAMPGEGKTHTSLNLALSISRELDHSVLLVDGDTARPSVHARLGVPTGAGLMDLLRDPSLDPRDLIQPTNVDKLSLLPAGPGGADATELLASATMDILLDRLAQPADRIVVIDAPPLLPTTESRVLSSRVGQVLVVVEAGGTRKRDLTEAMAMLAACPVVLTVLNKFTGPSTPGSYGY
jgi:receptor protein-tyrosine kinase